MIISNSLISMIRVELTLSDTITNEEIREFIVFNDIEGPEYEYWHILNTLWIDWLSK